MGTGTLNPGYFPNIRNLLRDELDVLLSTAEMIGRLMTCGTMIAEFELPSGIKS